MKIVTNKKDIKISVKGQIKKYSPFIIIEDDDLETFLKAGYKEVSELYNLAEMQQVSKNIDNSVKQLGLFLDETQEIIKEANVLNEQATANVDNITNMYNNIQKYMEYIKEHTEYNANVKAEIQSVSLNAREQIQLFSDEISKLKETFINDVKKVTSELFNEIDNKINIYADLDNKIKNAYSKAETSINELLANAEQSITESVGLARAWACNPVGVAVEKGLYSARHYSITKRGQQ